MKYFEFSPKHFSNVKVSALASMKMLKHAMSGVEQGRSENGISFEVMGLVVGKPEGDSIVGYSIWCCYCMSIICLLSGFFQLWMRTLCP